MQKAIWAIIILILIIGGGYYYWHRTSAQQPAANGTTVTFACAAGKSITATFYPSDDSHVDLVLSDGRSLSVPHAMSASGARYATADESFVFWNEGNTAFITEGGSQTFEGCVKQATDASGTLPNTYTNATTTGGWSIRYPSGWTPDPSYAYTGMGPSTAIPGVKFTIPASMATGTNLGSDTYLSVEQRPDIAVADCDASAFLDQGAIMGTSTKEVNGTTYSVASSTGAGAGNRYQETVYALPGTNPCTAVRYFVHYGVIENYPAGAVTQYDAQALASQFDQIRDSLVIGR
ncbi:MAG TPA: MliC family protein [Candidatus Paceibacterota bacterium]|nr:MliC family protein [Candidatus Paceibacterota bacterium]